MGSFSNLKDNYRTLAIISRGLYIFYPISKDNFFVFKEVFQKFQSLCMACIQERLVIKSGLAYDGARTVY